MERLLDHLPAATTALALALGGAALYLSYCYYAYPCQRSRRLPLPPGPKPLPLLGNLFDLSPDFLWVGMTQLAERFESDIVHLKTFGQSTILVSSRRAAVELLEKRSAKYSHRPRFPMILEVMGWNFFFAAIDYGDAWRIHRRFSNDTFHAQSLAQFTPHLDTAVHALLSRIREKPEDFMKHLRHMAGQIIMNVTYGIDIQPESDPYVLDAQRGVQILTRASVPGAYLVDTLPILRYIPAWMPGARFKRRAQEWHEHLPILTDKPFDEAKRRMDSGTAGYSANLLASALSRIAESTTAGEQAQYLEGIARGTCATMYIAGSDTTVVALSWVIAAMVLHPEIQKRAQAELDAVVGTARLPTLGDQADLPWVSACVREILRWRPPAPMGMPHALGPEDDEYGGYRIPAGAIIVSNIWAILHDPNDYPNPDAYKPERWLTPDGTRLNPAMDDPAGLPFGFGRRVCPGRHLAETSVWLATACMLATFDVAKKVAPDGQVVEPVLEYDLGVLAGLKPFECSITPRVG
ncbi:unnamed protein product [Mycena citricolor]|uniref:Cytochrome P450 n=1 Tax=Mycena citricolor TaxID=2018698 RepID=A0AAD2K8F9_9AGAR|nr:unnamed protein product [Mycena citricolor]